MATFSNIDTKPWKSLMLISFSTPIVHCLWYGFLNICDNKSKSLVYSSSSDDNYFSKIDSIERTFNDDKFAMLTTMLLYLHHILCATDDSELYELAKPFPLHQTVRLIKICKTILYRFIYLDPTILDLPVHDTYSELDSFNVVTKLHRYATVKSISIVLSDLYNRWARRPFFTPALWKIEALDSTRTKQELRDHSPFSISIYKYLPWSIDFYERMKIFREVLSKEKSIIQGTDDPHNRSKGTIVRIRRSMIVEDGIAAMDKVGNAIKDRIVIRYINNFGEEEAGIDIGGLFKDFVSDLSFRIFDPSYGLFAVTNKHELYPNPAVASIYPVGDIEKLYLFLGRVLGKALYENITLQPQFTHFFLSFMHGKYDYKNLIDDLNTYDEEIFKNLMFLKSYTGDLNDLGLTFSLTESVYGDNREINLIPNGSNVAVTDENKMRYINLVAKYYLHDRIKLQARAFFRGLYELIQPDILTIFCAPELQILISGSTGGISIDELKANTRYLGGYTAFDRNILWFWATVQEFNSDDLSKLIKFVTSCPRAPSLGFASLDPLFGIQRVECPDSRLPSASTCFNILKLPIYSSKNILKEKLLVSIRSGAGFDLS
jgi:ubiquitin-protein ligase E3 C